MVPDAWADARPEAAAPKPPTSEFDDFFGDGPAATTGYVDLSDFNPQDLIDNSSSDEVSDGAYVEDYTVPHFRQSGSPSVATPHPGSEPPPADTPAPP